MHDLHAKVRQCGRIEPVGLTVIGTGSLTYINLRAPDSILCLGTVEGREMKRLFKSLKARLAAGGK